MEKGTTISILTAIVALASAMTVAKLTNSSWFPIISTFFFGYILFVLILVFIYDKYTNK